MKIEKANKKRLYQDVDFLTSIKPARQYKNVASLEKAASYIENEFKKLQNLEVSIQKFEVRGQTYKNIVAILKGKHTKRMVIGAHYDVCGEQAGADDNASAVAGMLETARLLSKLHQHSMPNYTLEFVAYCLEEPPFFATQSMGSAVHAQFLHTQKIEVRLMVCFEMIGYFSDEPNSQKVPNSILKPLFPSVGNFIAVVGLYRQRSVVSNFAKLMKKHCQVPIEEVANPLTDELAAFSDQRNYWALRYEALMINDTSFMRNPHYHQETDLIETLNFDKMAEVVNGVVGALIEYE
jgi:Zn-dependent M28 family amino/carboxypeptidase